MKKYFELTFILILILCITIASSAQDLLPTSTTSQIIKHQYYTLSYSEPDEQAEWVFYTLTSDLVNGLQSRTADVRPDPKVSTTSAQLSDYKGSGFDRGHLCPAADMKINHEAMSETFFMSNMSPQHPSFNRGIWKKLEAIVRNWAIQEGRLYVVTGGVLASNIGSIGTNGVTVPAHYYKVVYDPTGEEKMIALVLPNEKGTKPLQTFVVSVDYVETLTGIDFFPALEDEIENKLEAKSDESAWKFVGYTSSSTSTSKSVATQCKGTAKSTGVRCKNKTTNVNGYCHLHQSQATGTVKQVNKTVTSSGRWQAITQAGTQCKRNAEAGGRYCWQHKK